MATISINIPDAALDRVLAAFDESYAGRVDDDGAELFTLAQWTKKHAAQYVKEILVGHEIKIAMTAARETARETAELVDIT